MCVYDMNCGVNGGGGGEKGGYIPLSCLEDFSFTSRPSASGLMAAVLASVSMVTPLHSETNKR